MQYYQSPTMSPPSDFHRHLDASQTFLHHRNFPCALKSALLAQKSDPTHPTPPQIIAISSILNAPPSDFYAILGLPPFTSNFNLIKTQFQNLKTLLTLSQNTPFPFASEAYGLVLKAWSVLSDPEKKSRFDQLGGEDFGKGGSFWTICPYCYYVYEYLKVYEDCCFKCGNEKCGKAFHGVALGNPPPEEMVEKGEYPFNGFVVLGGEVGEEKGGNVWSPFSVVGLFPCGKEGEGEGEGEGGETKGMGTGNVFIEISDEEIEDFEGKEAFEENVEDVGVDWGVGSEGGGVVGNIGKVGVGGEKIVGDVEEEGCSGKMVCGSRIKIAVLRSSRKLMGKGVRVGRDEVLGMQGISLRKWMNFGTEAGGLGFNMREDEIFVGLPDIAVGTI